jgi:glycosyltransferase involved in cell wall biosynthesis
MKLSCPRNVMIVMPAFRAEATLRTTFDAIPKGSYRDILLVDDCSDDGTVDVARGLGLSVIRHEQNRGYGANQKTCYRAALETDAEIIVMLHPDNQYDARVLPLMTEIIGLGICDIVLGSRIRSRRQVLAGGMPKWKYFLNRSSTLIENFLLGTSLGDLHSGYRAYRRNVLETIPFELNSDDFAFDQELIMQARHFGFEMGDLPVPVRYFDEASSINFKRSVVYAWGAVSCFSALTVHRVGVKTDCRFLASTDQQDG